MENNPLNSFADNTVARYTLVTCGNQNDRLEKAVVSICACVYGLLPKLTFQQAAHISSSSSAYLLRTKPDASALPDSTPTEERICSIPAIIDEFVREYRATADPPGRRQRLTQDLTWYFCGFRSQKERVSRFLSWVCVDLLNAVRESLESASSGKITSIPAEIFKLSRSLRTNKFLAISYISNADFVCFALLHPWFELCLKEGPTCILYNSLPNVAELLQWFDTMEQRPEVIAAREAFNSDLFSRLDLLNSNWPKDLNSFTEVFEDIIRERDSVRNCVTDKRSRAPTVEGVPMQTIKDKLDKHNWHPHYDLNGLAESEQVVPWHLLPPEFDPSAGGLSKDRAFRKRRQIDNLIRFARRILFDGSVVCDFCGGGGHLALVMGWMFPNVTVHLVDINEVSLALARRRLAHLDASGQGLPNVQIHHCDLRDWKMEKFDLGMAIHSCGILCDLVQEKCIAAGAAYLIVPCCFGSLKNNNASTEIVLPRSEKWRDVFQFSKHDYDSLCSAADQGSEPSKLDTQQHKDGKYAMSIIDEDRQQRARECGYSAQWHLTLQPSTITPKNEVILALPPTMRGDSSVPDWFALKNENLTSRPIGDCTE